MKKLLLLLTALPVAYICAAQLKTTASCPAFYIDILDGKINDLRTTATVGQVKEKFPCFTSAENESSSAKCGGGVNFKDRDLYFFTERDYVEIGPKFKGKLSIPLMGASRNGLFKWLGNPKIKDAGWDAFTTSYGTLILYYTKANKVNKIQFSAKTTDNIQLCQ
jgi:hypothetical protein